MLKLSSNGIMLPKSITEMKSNVVGEYRNNVLESIKIGLTWETKSIEKIL